MAELGRVVGDDFRIVAPLGEGGMGVLFVAEQLSTGRRCALKLMQQRLGNDPKLEERFVREAHIGSMIDSPYVANVLSGGIEAGTGVPWIAMDLLEGEDLHDHLEDRGALEPELVVAWLEQVCDALSAAHEAGVVHRDLKPRNVFLVEAEEPHLASVRVLDFGIAKLLTRTSVTGTETLGSPGWMPPEQSDPSARIGPSADVWSLGLLTFNMLTGKPFWRSLNDPDSALEMLLRETILDPIPPAHERASALGTTLPPRFDAWFARCLDRDPEQRYPSAGAAFAAFSRVVDGDESDKSDLDAAATLHETQARSSVPPSVIESATPLRLGREGASLPPAPAAAPSRRSRLLVASALATLALALGGATVLSFDDSAEPAARAAPTASQPPAEPPSTSSPPTTPSATVIPAAPRTSTAMEPKPEAPRPARKPLAEWHTRAQAKVDQLARATARTCGSGYTKASVQYAVAPDGSARLNVIITNPHGSSAAQCVRAGMSTSFSPPGAPKTLSAWVMAPP